MSKFYNISVDDTLGGQNPLDEVVSSQKAVKKYVDDLIEEKGGKLYLAVSSTAASTKAKTAILNGFVLETGKMILLKLENTSSVADATLNVNGTGAKTIKLGGSNTSTYNFTAGYYYMYYDGTYWNAVFQDKTVIQRAVTTGYNDWRPLLLAGMSSSTQGFQPSTKIDETLICAKIQCQPSNGVIMADKFLVPSGLSSQFLKADGSIDSNTYLTQHQDISGKEDKSNKVASISVQSTDTQYPSAKAIWTALQNIDADTLDGKHSSYYAAASSLSNYLPLTGGTMSGPLVINHNPFASVPSLKIGSGRYLCLTGNNITLDMSSNTGGWVGSFFAFKDAFATNTAFGFYGNASVGLKYFYLGGTYTAPIARLYPTSRFQIDKSGDIVPEQSNTYSLGSSSAVWKNIYGRLIGNADSATNAGNADTLDGKHASEFVVKNGTSSQFLKADGSIDSNTYLTQHQDISGKENSSNKVTTLDSSSAHYPSCSAVKNVTDSLSSQMSQLIQLAALKENTINKVTSISAQSTDVEYPSAKAVYRAISSIYIEKYEQDATVNENGSQLEFFPSQTGKTLIYLYLFDSSPTVDFIIDLSNATEYEHHLILVNQSNVYKTINFDRNNFIGATNVFGTPYITIGNGFSVELVFRWNSTDLVCLMNSHAVSVL